MSGAQEAFPAYAELIELTNRYGGMRLFEGKLDEASSMAATAMELEEKNIPLTRRGKRTYGRAQGSQDFVDAARKAFDAADRGEMHEAEAAALVAKQYQRTFFNLFNHGMDPRKG